MGGYMPHGRSRHPGQVENITTLTVVARLPTLSSLAGLHIQIVPLINSQSALIAYPNVSLQS